MIVDLRIIALTAFFHWNPFPHNQRGHFPHLSAVKFPFRPLTRPHHRNKSAVRSPSAVRSHLSAVFGMIIEIVGAFCENVLLGLNIWHAGLRGVCTGACKVVWANSFWLLSSWLWNWRMKWYEIVRVSDMFTRIVVAFCGNVLLGLNIWHAGLYGVCTGVYIE